MKKLILLHLLIILSLFKSNAQVEGSNNRLSSKRMVDQFVSTNLFNNTNYTGDTKVQLRKKLDSLRLQSIKIKYLKNTVNSDRDFKRSKNYSSKLQSSLLLPQTGYTSNYNFRVSAQDENLLYEILNQKYNTAGAVFENSKLKKLIYEASNRTRSLEFLIDQDENIIDTTLVEIKEIEENSGLISNFIRCRDLNGNLVKVIDQEGILYDDNGNPYFQNEFQANVFYEVHTDTYFIGKQVWKKYSVEGLQLLLKQIEYNSDNTLIAGYELVSSYDENGRLLTQSEKKYNPITSQWILTKIIENEFSGDYQNLESYLEYDLSGNLVTSFRYINQYNENEDILLDEGLEFDELESIWRTTYKTIYDYDNQSRLISEKFEEYDDLGSIVNGYLEEYQFNDNGDNLLTIYNNYDMGKWTTYYAEQRDFEENGNMIIEMIVTFNSDSTYDTGDKHTFLFDSENNLIEEEYSIVEDMDFKNIDRFEFSYSNGQLSEAYSQIWDDISENWVNYIKDIYSYSVDTTEIQSLIWNTDTEEYSDYQYLRNVKELSDLDYDQEIIYTANYNEDLLEPYSLDTITYFGSTDKLGFKRSYNWNTNTQLYSLYSYRKIDYNTDTTILLDENYSKNGGGSKFIYTYNNLGFQTSFQSYFTNDIDPTNGIIWNLNIWLQYDYDDNSNLILKQYFTIGYGYKYEYAYSNPNSSLKNINNYYLTYDINYEPWINWTLVNKNEKLYDGQGNLTSYEEWNNSGGGEKTVYKYSNTLLKEYSFQETTDTYAEDGILYTIKNQQLYEYNASNLLTIFIEKEYNEGSGNLENISKYAYGYDQNYNEISKVFFIWDGLDWDPSLRDLSSFDLNSNILFETTHYYNVDHWVVNDSTLYEYDINSLLILKTEYQYDQDQIQSGQRWIYRYKETGFDEYCKLTISGDTILRQNEVQLTADIQNSKNYEWMDLNNNAISSNANVSILGSGKYFILAENDACNIKDSVNVYDLCELNISVDSIIYPNQEAELTANLSDIQNAKYSWYNSIGEIISSNDILNTNIPDIYEVISFGDFCYGERVITVANVTRINYIDLVNTQVSIYPNPTTDYIILDLSNQPWNGSIELMSISGTLINEYKISDNNLQIHIDLNGVPSGIYLLNISSETNERISKRLIIN